MYQATYNSNNKYRYTRIDEYFKDIHNKVN